MAPEVKTKTNILVWREVEFASQLEMKSLVGLAWVSIWICFFFPSFLNFCTLILHLNFCLCTQGSFLWSYVVLGIKPRLDAMQGKNLTLLYYTSPTIALILFLFWYLDWSPRPHTSKPTVYHKAMNHISIASFLGGERGKRGIHLAMLKAYPVLVLCSRITTRKTRRWESICNARD